MGSESVGVSAELIVPFMNAVRQVFEKMVRIEATVQAPRLKERGERGYSVCGIIGISGEVTGSVVVSFSDSAAVKLVEAFAGMSLEPSSADFADAIGELANMIAGSAKQHLGGRASISVPNVVMGRGYTVAAPSGVPCVVIPCTSVHGDFAVEVSIKRHAA
jgi:chemotaxis protein CheX